MSPHLSPCFDVSTLNDGFCSSPPLQSWRQRSASRHDCPQNRRIDRNRSGGANALGICGRASRFHCKRSLLLTRGKALASISALRSPDVPPRRPSQPCTRFNLKAPRSPPLPLAGISDDRPRLAIASGTLDLRRGYVGPIIG